MTEGRHLRGYERELIQRDVDLGFRFFRRPDLCWFCSRTEGKATREHIFPLWLLRRLGAENDLFAPTHLDRSGRPMSTRGPIPARRFVAGRVCADCNSGWMSELEQEFEAVMFPRGGRHGMIPERSLDIIAHWLAKSAIVINSSQNYRVMVPEAVRHKTTNGAPQEFGVFLAQLQNLRGRIGYGQGVNAVGLIARMDEGGRPDWLTDFRAHRLFGAQIQVDEVAALVTYAPPDNWARRASQ